MSRFERFCEFLFVATLSVGALAVVLLDSPLAPKIEAKAKACECAVGGPCECCRCPAVKH